VSDRDYHEVRARDELARAEEASDPAIARIHRELAALHRRRMIEAIDDESAHRQDAPARLHGTAEHIN
jgi:hypothetical protein